MRRIILLATVTLVMAAIMVASAFPAFAAWDGPCKTGDIFVPVGGTGSSVDRNQDGAFCEHTLPGKRAHFYDNR